MKKLIFVLCSLFVFLNGRTQSSFSYEPSWEWSQLPFYTLGGGGQLFAGDTIEVFGSFTGGGFDAPPYTTLTCHGYYAYVARTGEVLTTLPEGLDSTSGFTAICKMTDGTKVVASENGALFVKTSGNYIHLLNLNGKVNAITEIPGSTQVVITGEFTGFVSSGGTNQQTQSILYAATVDVQTGNIAQLGQGLPGIGRAIAVDENHIAITYTKAAQCPHIIVFNVATLDTSTDFPDPPANLALLYPFLIGENLYALGMNPLSPVTATGLITCTPGGTWENVASLNPQVSTYGALSFDDKIFLSSGEVFGTSGTRVCLIYNVTTKTWGEIPLDSKLPQLAFLTYMTIDASGSLYGIDGSSVFIYGQKIVSSISETVTENILNPYPNPCSSTITTYEKEKYITDIIGNKIFLPYTTQNNTVTLDVSSLAKGMYLTPSGKRFIRQ